jgi:Arc/MetJ-type ribon-helix-helix transcriptional regulator
MTNVEKIIKATIEKAVVEGRIDELKRAKTYTMNSSYIRTRLRKLEEKLDQLNDILDGNEEGDEREVKYVFRIPAEGFKNNSKFEDILQFFKRDYLVEV